ncbi:hypothetical protein [Geobacillus thermoleovorans]|uniref:hypothetical protein n=1 Tax=Geobacillus thermoleovorans TaxID=33941 RepID=UPI000B29100C|nr:hypothetical protein [Geobacillus thermoleovorans]
MKHASQMAAAICLAAAIALGGNGQTVDAAVQWGQVQWKQGMIGKVAILRDTPLYRLNGAAWQTAMTVKQGREYRVYSQKRAGAPSITASAVDCMPNKGTPSNTCRSQKTNFSPLSPAH